MLASFDAATRVPRTTCALRKHEDRRLSQQQTVVRELLAALLREQGQ